MASPKTGKTWVESVSREGWLAKLANWYERDWQNAIDSLAHGTRTPPPDADEVIELLPEDKRELARSTVRSIDQYYRETYQSASGGHAHHPISQLTGAVVGGAAGNEYPTLDSAAEDLSLAGGVEAELPAGHVTGESADQATMDLAPSDASSATGLNQPTQDASETGASAFATDRGRPTHPKTPNAASADVATGEFSLGDLSQSPTIRRGRRTVAHTMNSGAPAESAIRFHVGDMVGDYRIERVLGRGGMGIVFLARQMKLDRLVALKMILSGAEGVRDSQLARFEAEAKAIAKFQHENIVRIFETGTHEGMPFFSLEYIEGMSLSEWMHEGPLEYDDAARLADEIARGIHYAHGRGIVHRDLKPANVLLTLDSIAKVTDFGLAKEVEADQSLSIDGAVVGTPGFMAPEQVTQTHEIGPAADVWGLGSVLYAMLTGQPPFLGANRGESMMMLIQEDPVRPSKIRSGVPIDLETICLKCLEKDPTKRYASAEAVAEDLGRFRRGEPIEARAITRIERVIRWCRRNPTIAVPSAAAACLALAMAVGGPIAAGTIYQQKEQVQQANEKLTESEQQARAAEAIAVQSKQAAEKGLKNATDALKVGIYKTVNVLKDRPGMSHVRNDLLETARTQLGLTDGSIDPELQSSLDVARVLVATGEMNTDTGRLTAAKQNYEKCLRVVQILDQQNELPKRLPNLSKAEQRLGRACLKIGELATARQHLRSALTHRQQWLQQETDENESDTAGVVAANRAIGETLGTLGTVEKYMGNYAAARDYLQRSLQRRQELLSGNPEHFDLQMDVVGGRRALVLLDDHQYGGETAIEPMKQILKDFVGLAEAEVASLYARANAGLAANQLGIMQLAAGHNREAAESFETGIRWQGEASEEDPERADLKGHLADSLEGRLIALRRTETLADHPEQKRSVERVLSIRRELFDLDPYNPQRRHDLIRSLVRFGQHDDALKLAKDLRDPSGPDDTHWISTAAALAMLSSIPDETLTTTDDSMSADELRASFVRRAKQILATGLELNLVLPSVIDREFDLDPIRDQL